MKKIFLALLLLVSSIFLAQTPLKTHAKIEAGFQGLDIGYDIPLNPHILADVDLGFGGITNLSSGNIGYKFGKSDIEHDYTLFLKAQLRYYLNRERRGSKGHMLENNAGSFIGFQSKFNFAGNGFDVGKSWLNDIHFGQQLPIGKNFIFRYQIGIGYGSDLDFKESSLYPAVGATFGYYF